MRQTSSSSSSQKRKRKSTNASTHPTSRHTDTKSKCFHQHAAWKASAIQADHLYTIIPSNPTYFYRPSILCFDTLLQSGSASTTSDNERTATLSIFFQNNDDGGRHVTNSFPSNGVIQEEWQEAKGNQRSSYILSAGSISSKGTRTRSRVQHGK